MFLKNILGEDYSEYLKSRIKPGVEVLLLLATLYEMLVSNLFLLLTSCIALLGAMILRAPRLICYLMIGFCLVLKTYSFVFVDATAKHDILADRDDAAEIAATAFLNGENPWDQRTALNNQITTGPTSVLIITPFVALFGRINELTFLFWIAFLMLLVLNDIREKNNTFSILALFYLAGALFIYQTQHWSLEELYYPFLLLFLAWLLAKSNHLFFLGLIIISAILSRINYSFTCFAFLCWLFTTKKFSIKGIVAIIGGILVGTLLILTPFVLVGGKKFLTNNPFSQIIKNETQVDPSRTDIPLVLERISNVLTPLKSKSVRAFISLAILIVCIRPLNKISFNSPFWHMAIAGWLAHSFVWYPQRHLGDYPLMFIIPAFFAVSVSNNGSVAMPKVKPKKSKKGFVEQ